MNNVEKIIYTFNARDNIIFPLIKEYFNLSDDEVFQTIWQEFETLQRRLDIKGIKYTGLKGALIPNQEKDKYETCLVIDTEQVPFADYGYYVFDCLLACLDKNSTFSILQGDFISLSYGNTSIQSYLKNELENNLHQYNFTEYKNSSQYYLIYINRLTRTQREKIVEGLKSNPWFVGYVDTTYNSGFKTYIASILPQLAIKSKDLIIGSHPEDIKDEENVNMRTFPFEKHGFRFVSINEISYDAFLTYKIEMEIANKEDVSFAYNALFPRFDSTNKIRLNVKDDKWEKYLKDKEKGKGVLLEKIDVYDLSKEVFISVLYKKICNNYLYNLRQNEQGDLLFDVCIEMRTINGHIRKTLVALKYLPIEGEMQVVTMT